MGEEMVEMAGNDEKKQSLYKEKTWLTCREAASLLNFSQRHILNLIKSGKLSADMDENRKYYIQKSEFFRVYPNAMKSDNHRNEEKLDGSSSKKLMEEKIKHLQEMVAEKNKQNEFLTEQLDNFTQEKSKMLDAINSHARLLEFKETTAGERPAAKGFGWWPFKKR